MNEIMRKILMLPEQASTYARDIDLLHYVVISITMLGATAVALVTGIFIIRYRASAHRNRDPGPDPRPYHSLGGIPFWLEGTVIAGLLSLFVAFWVVGFYQYMHVRVPPRESDIDVYVTGKQWMWQFAYPDGGGSNHVLYVPADRQVRLILTSRDVIHSFFVPAFRLKQDAVPGRMTTAWFEASEPGRYPIYCTEYCGPKHSTMLGEVVVLPPGAYDRFLDELPRTGAGDEAEVELAGETSLSAIGERVAAREGCLRCHTVDGAPHLGPTWAGVYGSDVRLASGEVVRADEAYLTESMMDPQLRITAGFQPIMPSYHGKLTAAETAALVEYIRSLADVGPGRPHAPLAPAEAPDEIPLPQGEPEELLP